MTNRVTNRLWWAVWGVALCLGPYVIAHGQTDTASNQELLNDPSPKGALARYRDFSKYPPESRPLSTSNWDLLNPWTVDTPTLPLTPLSWNQQLQVLTKSGASRAEIAQHAGVLLAYPSYHFTANKLALAGIRDELDARLEILPAPGANTTPAFQVTRAELIGDSSFGYPHLGGVPFSCEAGTNPVCTFRWHAPAAEKQYWGVLQLRVTLSLEGKGADNMAVLQFYSSPIVAGKFTGDFHERLEGGSLLVDAGVSVQKRMVCFVSANLYSVDKKIPTHHAERRMIVDPSMSTITFTFFGKIFRDYGHQGVFRMQDLKAQCENVPFAPEWFMDSGSHRAELEALQSRASPAPEPGRIYFEYSNITYTTKRYSNNSFSDQEWQSPERTRKLQMLQKSAALPEDPATLELLKQLARQ